MLTVIMIRGAQLEAESRRIADAEVAKLERLSVLLRILPLLHVLQFALAQTPTSSPLQRSPFRVGGQCVSSFRTSYR